MANPNDTILESGETMRPLEWYDVAEFPLGAVILDPGAQHLSASEYQVEFPLLSGNYHDIQHAPMIARADQRTFYWKINAFLGWQIGNEYSPYVGFDIKYDKIFQTDRHQFFQMEGLYNPSEDPPPPSIPRPWIIVHDIDDLPATNEEAWLREFGIKATRVGKNWAWYEGQVYRCPILWEVYQHDTWRIYTFQGSGHAELRDVPVELKLEGPIEDGRLIGVPEIYEHPYVRFSHADRPPSQTSFAAGMYLTVGNLDNWPDNVHDMSMIDLQEIPEIYECRPEDIP